jgi:hypothetical protein
MATMSLLSASSAVAARPVYRIDAEEPHLTTDDGARAAHRQRSRRGLEGEPVPV